jgi:hypothetical protein
VKILRRVWNHGRGCAGTLPEVAAEIVGVKENPMHQTTGHNVRRFLEDGNLNSTWRGDLGARGVSMSMSNRMERG